MCVKSVSFIFLAQIDRIKDPLNGTFEKDDLLLQKKVFKCGSLFSAVSNALMGRDGIKDDFNSCKYGLK